MILGEYQEYGPEHKELFTYVTGEMPTLANDYRGTFYWHHRSHCIICRLGARVASPENIRGS